jgi:hypothetical protein
VKVDLLLAFAYESRDLRIGELFLIQRKHRRAELMTELLTIDMYDAQTQISDLYTDLDVVKRALAAEGYQDEVDKYVSMNELAGANTPPCSFGFFYERPGTPVSSLPASSIR